MARRKGGLYVPLDVNFWDDQKVMLAGEEAATLYLAMLCKSKALLSDGVLSETQISRLCLPRWKRRLTKLVEADLVVPWTEGSWAIKAWFKYNDSAVEVDAARNQDSARKKAVRDARISVNTRDGFRCVYCHATQDLAIDHILPLVKGGSHDESNMQTLCKSCNSKKGRRDGTGLTPSEARLLFGIRFTGHSPDTSPDTDAVSRESPVDKEKKREEKKREVPHGPCPGCSDPDCPSRSLRVVGDSA